MGWSWATSRAMACRTRSSPGESQVFPNAGDGTFGTPFLGHGWISGSGEGFTNYARVADFNADGNLDIVSLGTDGVQAGPAPRYVVTFGLGNGTFQPTAFYSPQGNGALNVAVADFNRDGLPDIAGWNISGSSWPWSLRDNRGLAERPGQPGPFPHSVQRAGQLPGHHRPSANVSYHWVHGR